MMKIKFLTLAIILFTFSASATAADRSLEIQTEMWSSTDKNFNAVDIPKKWVGKSAVIIAQLNRFEYRKAVILNQLRYNEYNHYRIKLLDKNAVNKYTEISYLTSRSENGESVKVFVGFKVIKPNGKEIVIDPSTAVTMEKEMRGRKRSYNKIAIPNLEPGDILDYYICDESIKSTNNLFYFFEPVIYSLPQEYPLVYHKLQFRAERRCFINLRSLNGAPELKLVNDEVNEEKYYTLEETDIEGIDDQRWLYPYRELPSIKFRAAFASGKAMRNYDVLLGKPGEVKSSVTKTEVEDMVATMLAAPYDVKFLTKNAKTKLKGMKDPFEIAKESYYFYRNQFYSEAELATVEGRGTPTLAQIKFTDVFSTFLTAKKIPHDIVLAIPRHISSLDDLLMEHEIEWLIRVKKGSEYLYLSPFDMNTVPGEIDVRLEGTEAYALDGLLPFKKSGAKRITLPVTSANENSSHVQVDVQLNDLEKPKISVKRTLTGRNKLVDQYYLMDIYDFTDEEKSRFKMGESFEGYLNKKKYQALKTAYLSKRDDIKKERIKASVERDFDLKIKEAGNLIIEQTGRDHKASAMVYNISFEAEDLVKKTGPNYLVDIGKLIEQQTKIESDELKRKSNVYFDNARSYRYTITFEVPKGYQVQGLEKLNQRVENSFGGFTSTAKEEKGKIIIETNKHYDVNFVPNNKWPDIVSFLNAAHSFTEQKILLKKK